MVSEAAPETSVAVPRFVPPLMKVTVPVALLGVTVAVSTVLAPTTTGFTKVVKTVELLARLTVWVTAEEVLVA